MPVAGKTEALRRAPSQARSRERVEKMLALVQLEAMGHEIRRRTTRGGVGGAQIIIFDRLTGTIIGGSTPHKDGMAVAY